MTVSRFPYNVLQPAVVGELHRIAAYAPVLPRPQVKKKLSAVSEELILNEVVLSLSEEARRTVLTGTDEQVGRRSASAIRRGACSDRRLCCLVGRWWSWGGTWPACSSCSTCSTETTGAAAAAASGWQRAATVVAR